MKDPNLTFEHRKILYQEPGQEIDDWTRGLLAQKVEFAGFMSKVRALVTEKKDYTFEQYITLYCAKSRTEIFKCLRIYKNRKMLKKENLAKTLRQVLKKLLIE